MRWYALVRFRCPACGQRLAVEHGQVRRGELVTCQNCNTDMQLAAPGGPEPAPRADGAPAPFRVELAV